MWLFDSMSNGHIPNQNTHTKKSKNSKKKNFVRSANGGACGGEQQIRKRAERLPLITSPVFFLLTSCGYVL